MRKAQMDSLNGSEVLPHAARGATFAMVDCEIVGQDLSGDIFAFEFGLENHLSMGYVELIQHR